MLNIKPLGQRESRRLQKSFMDEDMKRTGATEKEIRIR